MGWGSYLLELQKNRQEILENVGRINREMRKQVEVIIEHATVKRYKGRTCQNMQTSTYSVDCEFDDYLSRLGERFDKEGK